MTLCRSSEAQTLLSEVEQVVRNPRPEDRWMLWRFSQHFFHTQGEIHLAEGDAEQAFSLADECLQLAELSNSKKYIIKARRLRGQALRLQGDLSGSIEELEIAVRGAATIGNPAQAWKSNAALAGALRQARRGAEAAQASRRAREIVDKVALELRGEPVHNAFAGSKEIQAIREAG